MKAQTKLRQPQQHLRTATRSRTTCRRPCTEQQSTHNSILVSTRQQSATTQQNDTRTSVVAKSHHARVFQVSFSLLCCCSLGNAFMKPSKTYLIFSKYRCHSALGRTAAYTQYAICSMGYLKGRLTKQKIAVSLLPFQPHVAAVCVLPNCFSSRWHPPHPVSLPIGHLR